MALQGNLRTVRVPELFSFLHQLRKTGVLYIVAEEEERGFLFFSGNLVYATTKDSSKRLGNFLVRLGIVTPEELQAEISREAGTEIYFGQRLVDSGRVSRQQLNAAVQEQILDITQDVLMWGSGAFHFDDNEIPFAIPDGVLISTHAILLEASRRSDEKEHVRGLFPDLCVVLRRSESEEEAILEPEASEVLCLIDGKRSLEQVLFASPLGSRATASSLHSLVSRGLLHQVGIKVHASLEPPVPEISYLPVAPHTAGKIFSIFNQEDSQLPRLCEVLATDPLLTAKVLKFVASRHADIPRGSLQYSYLASILGTFQLRSLLIPEALRGFYFPRPQCFWKDCWEHSYFVARLARQLALRIGYAYPEEAYIAGLLHNLGIYILMDNGPDKYREVVQESVSARMDIEEVEEDHFGISHTRIGGVYAEKWGLPRNIVLAIKYHHKVDGSVTNPLLNILAVALDVAHEQGVGTEYLAQSAEQGQLALKKLQLNRKKALSILEEIPRAVPLEAEC